MNNLILHPNATPVYGFLRFINSQNINGEESQPNKILDWGAGGLIPPLALFQHHGFESWGIDISEEQLDKARQFCRKKGIEINLREGDMRHIP